MWTTLSSNAVRIRKPHICHCCGKRYSPPQSMVKVVCVDGGDFSSTYNCPICVEFIKGPHFDWSFHDEGIDRGCLWEYDEYRDLRKRYQLMTIDN